MTREDVERVIIAFTWMIVVLIIFIAIMSCAA